MESPDFSLSWSSFVYNVEKSYVAIDLVRFFYLGCLMIEWWGQNFIRPKTCYNLIKFSIFMKIFNLGV